MEATRFPPFGINQQSPSQNSQNFNVSQAPNLMNPSTQNQLGNYPSQSNIYPKPGQYIPGQPLQPMSLEQGRPYTPDGQYQQNQQSSMPPNFRPPGTINQFSGNSSEANLPMSGIRPPFIPIQDAQPINSVPMAPSRTLNPNNIQGNSFSSPTPIPGNLAPNLRPQTFVPSPGINPPFSSSSQQPSGINPPFNSAPVNNPSPRFAPFSNPPANPSNLRFPNFNAPGNSTQGQPFQLSPNLGGSSFNPSQPPNLSVPSLMQQPTPSLIQKPNPSLIQQPNPSLMQMPTQNYTENQAINQPFKNSTLNQPFTSPSLSLSHSQPFLPSNSLLPNPNNPALNKAQILQGPPIVISNPVDGSPSRWTFIQSGMSKNFSKSETGIIETAFREKKDYLILKSNEGTFLIDFKTMTRRKLDDNSEPINREGGGVSWKWRNEDGTWRDYSAEDTQTIESGYQNFQKYGGPTSIILNGRYTIDFLMSKQVNTRTKFDREIKRYS